MIHSFPLPTAFCILPSSCFLCVSVPLWLLFFGDLRPDQPMIGNIQRLGYARTHHADTADENPIRMKAQARAPPRRRAGLKWRRIAARLHQLSNLDRLLV